MRHCTEILPPEDPAEISLILNTDKLQISKYFFRELRQPPEKHDI